MAGIRTPRECLEAERERLLKEAGRVERDVNAAVRVAEESAADAAEFVAGARSEHDQLTTAAAMYATAIRKVGGS